jgi:hypothetical protein
MDGRTIDRQTEIERDIGRPTIALPPLAALGFILQSFYVFVVEVRMKREVGWGLRTNERLQLPPTLTQVNLKELAHNDKRVHFSSCGLIFYRKFWTEGDKTPQLTTVPNYRPQGLILL